MNKHSKNIIILKIKSFKIGILFALIIAFMMQSCQPSLRFATQKQDKAKPQHENTDSDNLSNFKTGDETVDALLNEAENWVGVSYQYGGESKSGADCSGFVQQVFYAVGIDIPRTSIKQFEYAENVDFADKKAGDLIFFKNKGRVNHVGIYLGQGYMIHSSTTLGVVKQSIHDTYYTNRIAGVGRIKNNKISKN